MRHCFAIRRRYASFRATPMLVYLLMLLPVYALMIAAAFVIIFAARGCRYADRLRDGLRYAERRHCRQMPSRDIAAAATLRALLRIGYFSAMSYYALFDGDIFAIDTSATCHDAIYAAAAAYATAAVAGFSPPLRLFTRC